MSSNIPFHIQVEIVKRIPLKPLIRFRSVCKTWKSLIDSSHFIAAYNNVRHDQPQHLLVGHKVRHGEESEVKYVCLVDDDSFPQQKFALTVSPLAQVTKTVIGSSHGLLCLTGWLREPDGSHPVSETNIVVLWNPAIRKSIGIVVPNEVHPPFNYVIGFGVCPDTKDPKIVKITYINDLRKMESINSIPCQVMVFTLSSGKWTTSCSNQLPRKSIQFTRFQTIIGQFIYWVAHDWICFDGKFTYHNMIMSFDLSTYEFREVDLLDSLRESCLFISRLRESLVLLEYYINFTTDKQICDVWMMEPGDRKVFTKLFTINPPNASLWWTLGFRKTGEPIIQMEDDHKDLNKSGALVVYEPCSEHIKDLGICGRKHSLSSYMETLLLLDHDDGHIVGYGAVKR